MPKRTPASPVRSIPDTFPDENRTLGWSVLQWTATYLQQPDGPTAGQRWVFTPEQVKIVLRWFAIDENGRFLARRGVVRRMKGWGKDPFLAALAAVELCGPCRFGGWDANGLPVAIPHPAPWIQIAAVSQDQTWNTMGLFPALFTNEAITEYKLDLGKTVIYAGVRAHAKIEAVTSSPRALEGKRSTFTIKNESHLWIAANDGHAMNQAINRNLAKSNDGSARSMEITNAHLPGEDSVAEQTYEALRAANGNVPGLYYDSVEAPPIADLSDVKKLKQALELARNDSTWLDIERLAEEIADPVTPEWLSRRYYLNQVVRVDVEHWMPPAEWKLAERPGQDVPRGARVVLGFDGSFSGDSTAIVVVQIDETPHLDVVKLWENRDHDPEWRVPIEDVEQTIRDACKTWRVREIVADAHLWARSLEILAAEKLPVMEFPQSPTRMIPATYRFKQAIVNGALTHSGNADLTRHVENAVVKISSRGEQIAKDSKTSPRKIDLAVAAVMALERAAFHAQKKKPRVISLADYQ